MKTLFSLAITLIGIYDKDLQMVVGLRMAELLGIVAIGIIIYIIVQKAKEKKYGKDETVKCNKYYVWDISKYEQMVIMLSNNKISSLKSLGLREREVEELKKIDLANKNLSDSKWDSNIPKVFKLLYEKKFLVRISSKEENNQILENVNALLEKLRYKKQITIQELHSDDNQNIINRRKNNYSTLKHDLNTITKILREHNYELILLIDVYDDNTIYAGIIKLEDMIKFEK